MTACLYIVATPIGNLDDISLRAKRILEECEILAAEDTRRAGQLLSHLAIGKKELVSYFDHVEEAKAPQLIQRLLDDQLTMALISDAGTPCVSDPGYRLVAEAHRKGVPVVPIPGASALTALVSASGLPSDRFLFVGFLPSKDQALQKEVESWGSLRGSVIFYESTRRLKKALHVIARLHPEATVAVGRELTKLHEELVHLKIAEALQWCESHTTLKGEAAVMVSGFSQLETVPSSHEDLEAQLEAQLRQGKRFKEVLKDNKDCGLNRQDLYQLLVKIKEKIRES